MRERGVGVVGPAVPTPAPDLQVIHHPDATAAERPPPTAPPEALAAPVAPAAPTRPARWQRLRAVTFVAGAHAWAVTAVLALIVALVGFRGGDFAAQDYRVWVFKTHGFLIWDVNWYGGHSDLGYSVLFPAVGSWLGTVPAAALAGVLSTILWGRIVGPATSWAAAVSRLWFAVFVVGDLIVGRAPFACAVTAALAAIYTVIRGRPELAGLAAVIASLFSPLGAAFLVLIGIVWSPSIGWRRALPLAGSFVGLAITALVGDGGIFPFPWTGFVGQLTIVALGLAATPRAQPVVRRALWLYGAICVALFLVPNPVGGNMARLTGMVIGPVAAYVLLRAGRVHALAVLTVPLLAFQLQPVVAAVASAAGDLSTKAGYYHGMLHYLSRHDWPLGRVEIPFTRDHWEATYVAEQQPLARGWDRQVDVARNAELYQPLSASAYHDWLRDNAVRYVALPDAPLDQGGKAEDVLLRHAPSYLKPVYSDAHWRIWQVVDATPLASGVGAMTALTPSGFTISQPKAGATLVRLRWSQSWKVDSGWACLAQAPAGWTTVVAFTSGDVIVSARTHLDSVDACTPAELANAGVALPSAS